jgi:hypothetical protein
MKTPEIESRASGKCVIWEGENGVYLRVIIDVAGGRPSVRELAFDQGKGWTQLAGDLVPEFEITTGIPEERKDQPFEERWWNYSDTPLAHKEDIRRAQATFDCAGVEATTDGSRAEISCPGVRAGIFEGSLRFTVYSGSNLFRVELVAATLEDSVAYMYRGGLSGFGVEGLFWIDPSRNPQQLVPDGNRDEEPVRVRARSRIVTASLPNGSVACFPPPHSFIWDRQLEINVGFNYYRRDGDTVALGVRHNEESEYPEGQSNPRPWELYNARPGSEQRMPVFIYLCSGDREACRAGALAYTRNERYKPVPGYKTMVVHFHMAFWQAFRDNDTDNLVWIDLFKELGINIVHPNDFHGDGHPRDTTELRLEELKTYHEACSAHSSEDFLIIPGEEPNAHTGGHWDLMLPGPVFYTNYREEGQPFEEEIAPYGKVYHIGSSEDLERFLLAEAGLTWTTHPRTKSSIGYPDAMRDTSLFRSRNWIGASCSYLPADLSFKRLIEDRCEGVFDDMNQWVPPKMMIAEVGTYKKRADYDLHGDFLINYVKVDEVPAFGDWSSVTQAVMNGDFFVTSGEVLIENYAVENGKVTADVEWTFPLDFVEVVWGGDEGVARIIVRMTDRLPFGKESIDIEVPAAAKWVRFAAWDCAMNGAFSQPVRID